MRLTEAAEPIFARHETFHPRYGWFRKAYATAAASERGFTAEDAPVAIGVGKNMVRSIKFWGQAAKVITSDPDSANKRAPDMIPTAFGQALFGPDGWDPYMEDPGTVWLLHWLLLAPPSWLPVWWLAFNELHAVDFNEDLLASVITTHIESASSWSLPHPATVTKDLSVLFRTYAPAVHTARASFEDLLDCPLRELGLITRSAATGNHRFVLGPKPTLPEEIVNVAVLDYLARRQRSGQTVTLAHLANESGSPGRAFRLSERDIYEALSREVEKRSSLDLLAPTGAQQLAWTDPPAQIAVEILNEYYETQPAEPAIGQQGDEPADRDLLPDRSHAVMRLLEASSRHHDRSLRRSDQRQELGV